MPKNVQGIELVNKRLAQASTDMLDDVKLAIELTLDKAVKHAKANHGPDAHDDERFVTRTGHLVQSIHAGEVTIIPGESVEGYFAASREYAEFVEKGTSKSAPYAYMWPAALAVSPFFKRAVKRALK